MVYCTDGNVVIRDMEPTDAQLLNDAFTAQGWHPDEEYYRMRMREAAEGRCVALTAVVDGEPAGTAYVYFSALEGPFRGTGLPIIVDLSVLKKHQRRGAGSRLMDVAEAIAARHADAVCLGVGLCAEYGSAQRLYIRRGYIPDGSGVWYRDKQCVQYETVCTVDDDLVLYLRKELRGGASAIRKQEEQK